MNNNYYIAYNPLTYSLMDIISSTDLSPCSIISYLTGKDVTKLNRDNYLDYTVFLNTFQRKGLVETLAIESYALVYIANQIAKVKKRSKIFLIDGKRKNFKDVISTMNSLPKGVFITTMSSNFPTAAVIAIVLNHAKIPVVIGGIHVSTTPEDVDLYIRKYCPFPELISIVKGAGDFEVISEVIKNIDNFSLKKEYSGHLMVENRTWGNENNIEFMEPLKIPVLNKLPVINKTGIRNFKINPVTPYVGCPFSCKFCSISTLPKKQRKFIIRDADDFIAELLYIQKNKIDLTNRYFFFLPDNLLFGGEKLKYLLDKIIASRLKINYAAQISIEVADDSYLLKKLRLSGATHFFIGLESLDIDNLKYIDKNVTKKIIKSKKSVAQYYSEKIKKIQSFGISIHASFVFGLPYDYFKSLNNHTGIDVALFCLENKIGIQPSSLTDLPGSILFELSHKNKNYLYGGKGSMEYFVSLCLTDLGETNRHPPDSLYNSPLVVAFLAYEAVKLVGHPKKAIKNSFSSALKSFLNPTKQGSSNIYERMQDSLCSFISQVAVSLYKVQGESLGYTQNGISGVFERLYGNEKNPYIREIFKLYVKQFETPPASILYKYLSI